MEYRNTYRRLTDLEVESDQWSGGTHVGLGAEWLPVERIGISGSTGIGATYRHIEEVQSEPELRSAEQSDWDWGESRWALFVSFYF